MSMMTIMTMMMMVEGLIPVIVLLPRSVPHLQLHLDSVHLSLASSSSDSSLWKASSIHQCHQDDEQDLDVSDIVLKDRGHILLGELIPAQQDDHHDQYCILHLLKTMRRQVFPQAPSPTITNFFRTTADIANLKETSN